LLRLGCGRIVYFVLTAYVGDIGGFEAKLKAMHEKSLMTAAQVETLDAAINAGNAKAHRGYGPSKRNVFTILDIAEALLQILR